MKIEYNGIELFKSFSQTVMEMTERFRQKEDPYFVKNIRRLIYWLSIRPDCSNINETSFTKVKPKNTTRNQRQINLYFFQT